MNVDDEKIAQDILFLLEEHLRNGKFDQVDRWLDECDPNSLPGLAILTILTITAHGKDKLINRDKFLIMAEPRMIAVYGQDRAENLLKNRR